jgi:hypothetical protein
MSFFKEIKEVLGWDPDSKTSAEQVTRDNPLFLYIKLPIDLEPEDRMALYADPLDSALAKDGLGSITGGGSMENEEGDGVAWSGVDAELYDVEKVSPCYVASSSACKRRREQCWSTNSTDRNSKIRFIPIKLQAGSFFALTALKGPYERAALVMQRP